MAQSEILRCRRRSKKLVLVILLMALLSLAAIQSSFHSRSNNFSLPSFIGIHNPNKSKHANKKCALLFFGLIKESFTSISLPSIQKNILSINPQCDIYLHTYNMTHVPINKRNTEYHTHALNISEASLLTSNAVFEEMESFYKHHQEILERTRKNYHQSWGECCESHDNMIKQWNSIEGVWDIMHAAEQKVNEKTNNAERKRTRYDQVGLFRSDVFYTRPIDIFDSQGALPNFAHHRGYNDRLFYGSYDNAKIWASKRFAFVDIFEKRYMKSIDYQQWDAWSKIRKVFGGMYKDGYHSETFVKRLLNHYGVEVDLRDHCVWRVRSGQRLLANDCDGMQGFSTFKDVRMYGLAKDADGLRPVLTLA